MRKASGKAINFPGAEKKGDRKLIEVAPSFPNQAVQIRGKRLNYYDLGKGDYDSD